MFYIVMFVLGYLLSYIVTRFLYNDAKAYQNGWEKAKETFNDWEHGYTEGWHDAEKYILRSKRINKEKEKYLDKASILAELY